MTQQSTTLNGPCRLDSAWDASFDKSEATENFIVNVFE